LNGLGEAVQAAIVFEVGLVDGEEGIAQQGQSANEIGIAATGVVLTQAGILAPMETVFDPCPVVSNKAYPLLGCMRVIQTVADVIAFFIESDALAGTEVMDFKGASRMGEVDLHGFDGDYSDPPRFVAAVSFVEDVKKGEAAVRSANRALMVGWLPLTWRR
jgi:hypothetical protein